MKQYYLNVLKGNIKIKLFTFTIKINKNNYVENIPLVPVKTGIFSVSESLSELSVELLEVESLRAPSSLSIVTEDFIIVVLFVHDDLEGIEFVTGNDPVDVKGQSSLSEPIIGKLANTECVTDGCTGELKFCVFLISLKRILIYYYNITI